MNDRLQDASLKKSAFKNNGDELGKTMGIPVLGFFGKKVSCRCCRTERKAVRFCDQTRGDFVYRRD
jgi:hypothetical protein